MDSNLISIPEEEKKEGGYVHKLINDLEPGQTQETLRGKIEMVKTTKKTETIGVGPQTGHQKIKLPKR